MLHFFFRYLLTQQRYLVLARGDQFYNIVKKNARFNNREFDLKGKRIRGIYWANHSEHY